MQQNPAFWRVHRLKWVGLGFGVSVLAVGCQATPQLLPWMETTAIELSLEAVPSVEPGAYVLSGDTNLPNKTQLMVVAVRYLELDRATTGASSETQTYSILDYQPATVEAGQWQTTLNLWEVSADGQYREPWQIYETRSGLDVTPNDWVQFWVTLASPDQLGAFDQALQEAGLQSPESLIQTTLNGDVGLHAEQEVAMALPIGQTTPPPLSPEEYNDGWGRRYLLVPEPPLPYTLEPDNLRQTNAPPSVEDFIH